MVRIAARGGGERDPREEKDKVENKTRKESETEIDWQIGTGGSFSQKMGHGIVINLKP